MFFKKPLRLHRRFLFLVLLLPLAVSCTQENVCRDQNHTFTTQYDSNGHWKECSICGYREGSSFHDRNTLQFDDDHHWFSCSICGYATSQEAHNWETEDTCLVCGLKKPQSQSSGGFNIQIIHQEPMGTLTVENKLNNCWTITLIDTNPDYPITQVRWRVDEDNKTEFDNKFQYVLETPSPRTYFVDCVIANQNAATTLETVVQGK